MKNGMRNKERMTVKGREGKGVGTQEWEKGKKKQ